MTDLISPDLKTAMRRLRLGKLLDTLPDRVALARQQKMAHQGTPFMPYQRPYFCRFASAGDSLTPTCDCARASLASPVAGGGGGAGLPPYSFQAALISSTERVSIAGSPA